MTTLIAVYNSEGCVGRCDAKCYEAEHPECECICGGLNHGTGLVRAQDNTMRWLIEESEAAGNPDLTTFLRRELGRFRARYGLDGDVQVVINEEAVRQLALPLETGG